jgi:hypothetical protein
MYLEYVGFRNLLIPGAGSRDFILGFLAACIMGRGPDIR